MKTMLRTTLLVVISVLLVSCLASKSPSTREIMNSLKGRHISDVIRAWGAYDHIVSDGAGGSIYIWIRYRQDNRMRYGLTRPKGNSNTIPGITTKILNENYEQRLATPIRKELFVRPDGRVYSWRVTGD